MGEMADYYNEMYDYTDPEDYWEPFQVKCKYCGNDQLEWVETDRGWRLANRNGKVHHCTKYENTKPTE